MHSSRELILGFNFIMWWAQFKQSDINWIVVSSDYINFDVSTVGLAKTEVFVDRRICVGY